MTEEISLRDVALAVRMGQKSIARELLHRRLKSHGNCVQSLLMSAALAERVSDAADLLNRALELDPANPLALRALESLRFYGRTGEPGATHETLRESHDDAQRAEPARIARCLICGYAARFDARAQCSVCGCVQRYECLGLVREPGVDEELVEQAVERLKEEAASGSSESVLRNLTLALLNLGRSAEALPHLESLLHRDPMNPDLRRLVEGLGKQPLVLVAGESAASLRTVSSLLSGHGYRVLAARDGCQVFQWLAEGQRPEAFVLECGVPGMNGFDICRELRKTPAFRHAPVIMISRGNLDNLKVRQAGVDEVIATTLLASSLKDVVRNRILRQRASGASFAASAA